MVSESGFVDAGFVVKAIEVGDGGEFEEVLVAGMVFGEKSKVVGGAIFAGGLFFVGVRTLADVGFHADNGFDVGFLAGLVKFDGSVHNAMIGDGGRFHFEVFECGDEVVDFGKAVEEGVFSVEVEMGEHKLKGKSNKAKSAGSNAF